MSEECHKFAQEKMDDSTAYSNILECAVCVFYSAFFGPFNCTYMLHSDSETPSKLEASSAPVVWWIVCPGTHMYDRDCHNQLDLRWLA
jgi:hypothetical protein